MKDRYKIVPGLFCRYNLMRWHGLPFLGFWDMDAGADDYDKLVETVRKCGGKLANPPQEDTK